MNALKGLTHPLKIQGGVIVDATGKPVIEVIRNFTDTTYPHRQGRDIGTYMPIIE